MRHLRPCSAHRIAILLLLIGVRCGSAHAQDQHANIYVRAAPGSCPSVTAVQAELGRLLQRHRPAPGAPVGHAPLLAVDDRGAYFQVRLGASAETYRDPGRRCDERARMTAVFAALTLEPPQGNTDAPPAPLPAPRRRPAPQSPRRLWIDLEVAGSAAAAPETGGAAGGGGGLLAVVVGTPGRGGLGLSLGLSAHSPVTQPFADRSVRLTRVPLHLSIRGALRRGRFEGTCDLGALLSIGVAELSEAGRIDPQALSRLTPGLHLALSLRGWAHPLLAPFAGLQMDVTPAAPAYAVAPGPPFGAAPRIWLGAVLGLAWRVRP